VTDKKRHIFCTEDPLETLDTHDAASGHASSNVTPSIDVRMSMRLGATPI
jgi:hypothetical protein